MSKSKCHVNKVKRNFNGRAILSPIQVWGGVCPITYSLGEVSILYPINKMVFKLFPSK